MSSPVLFAAFLISTAIAQHIQKYEEHMDRPGFDYNMFEFGPNVNAAVMCQQICTLDDKCQSWATVVIGAHGPNARCWLKSGIPVARPNECCTSGVPIRAIEPNVDRPGSDYLSFELTESDPDLCRIACADDKRCKAWTYVRPGVHSPAATCNLKDIIPVAFMNGCCTSGASGAQN
jgi:hypothetical protein